MNKYEEASITALTYLLNFSYFVDDVDSLKGQIAQFKLSLMLDLYGISSRENLQAVMTQVSALIEEIQKAASALFGKLLNILIAILFFIYYTDKGDMVCNLIVCIIYIKRIIVFS